MEKIRSSSHFHNKAVVLTISLLGIMVGIGWYIFNRPHGQYIQERVAEAKRNGFNQADYLALRKIRDREEKLGQKYLTASEWEDVKRYLKDPSPQFRQYTLSAVEYMANTPQREEAIQVVRPLLNDTDDYVVASALAVLATLGEPGIKTRATSMRDDARGPVAHAANMILSGRYKIRPGTPP